MKAAALLLLLLPARLPAASVIGRYCPAAGGGCPAPISDTFRIGVIGSDTSAAPTDAARSAIAARGSESNTAPTDTAKAGISGPSDTNAAPSDGKSATVALWLAAGTETSNVTNPNNANGQNDGSSSSQETVALGAVTSSMTKAGAMNTAFTSALFRGWFVATITLATSNITIKAHSTTGAYADITMLSVNATTNHSGGTFTFDLFAAGLNTTAKLNSTQIQFTTTDAAAGATPAVLTVDAGRIELGGVF